MKRILLLSLLVLFSCSKDSLRSADAGNQIIGNYQLILQTSTDQEEFSYWGEKGNTDITGTVNFTSDFKGYYDIIVKGENIRVNFDWSYDGSKWNLTDSNSFDWMIQNSNRCGNANQIYCNIQVQSNTSGVYIMMRTRAYYAMGSSKLVF
tara:strand:- start:504 stop:953 length:450 start_codon:yes stop_codon:yes gene_type:complete